MAEVVDTDEKRIKERGKGLAHRFLVENSEERQDWLVVLGIILAAGLVYLVSQIK